MSRTIAKQISTIRARIDKDYARIAELQDQCPHPNLVETHGANTGNYDPHADCYWTDYNCPDCGKRWTVFLDQ